MIVRYRPALQPQLYGLRGTKEKAGRRSAENGPASEDVGGHGEKAATPGHVATKEAELGE